VVFHESLWVIARTTAPVFHESLWVIAGTTAPVVALAAIVSLMDGLRENADSVTEGIRIQQNAIGKHYDAVIEATFTGQDVQAAYDRPIPDRGDKLSNGSGRLSLWLFRIGVLNLLLQAALLAVSLVSIEDAANLVWPWLAMAWTVGGLVLLTVSALGAFQLRQLRTEALRSEHTDLLTAADKPDPAP
jgi:hypothetical protein